MILSSYTFFEKAFVSQQTNLTSAIAVQLAGVLQDVGELRGNFKKLIIRLEEVEAGVQEAETVAKATKADLKKCQKDWKTTNGHLSIISDKVRLNSVKNQVHFDAYRFA